VTVHLVRYDDEDMAMLGNAVMAYRKFIEIVAQMLKGRDGVQRQADQLAHTWGKMSDHIRGACDCAGAKPTPISERRT
jgi:hypothetical protein